jgi:predicted PurR-regulated permease PerM
VLMSLIIGVYITVAMEILGVHYAILLGVAAAILELVPMVGAVVAMALAVIVALLQSPGLGIATVIVGLVGHALEAYVVGPRVSGRVTRLHPLVAMAALLIGAEVGGVLGALFGVPIAAIANILLGAAYRSQQGAEPLTTHADGEIEAESLPRLGDEIGGIDEEGVITEPVPRKKSG